MKKHFQISTNRKLFIVSIFLLSSLLCPIYVNGQINYLEAVNSNHQNTIQMITSPDNKFAYIIAYGEIQTYQRNPNNGQLNFLSSLSQMSPGNQLYDIRNIGISPDAKFIYTQGAFNTFVFSRDTATGVLTPFQTLTITPFTSYYPFTTNNIVVANNGRFIYISRGSNLFIYMRASTTGSLSLINTMQNLNNIPANSSSDISVLLSSDNRLAFITGGNSVSTYIIDTLMGNLTFKNIITGNNFVNQGLTYAIESMKSHNDKFLYTLTGSMGTGAINVLQRDSLTDSLSVIQTIYHYNNSRFINISDAKKLICVTGYALMFYQIDSVSGQLNYFSSFQDSSSAKYYGKKYIDVDSKYLYSCPYTDSVYIFQLDFALSTTSLTAEKFNFSSHPNPFSFQTTLQSTIPLSNATLIVENSFGQAVKQIKNISGKEVTLHRDHLPCGLYYVKLNQDSKTIFTGKLIIVD